MSQDVSKARDEVNETLKNCNFCTIMIGISLLDKLPTTFIGKFKYDAWFFFSIGMLTLNMTAELAFMFSLMLGTSSVATLVAALHLFGYGVMSLAKLVMMWLKRSVFRKAVDELVELWPVHVEDKDGAALKHSTLKALRFAQLCYMFWNMIAVTFYNVTPIVLYVYRYLRGHPADLGFIWFSVYPFDKHKPVLHEFIYLFEAFSGVVAIWGQLGSDLIFTTMASHISMLLRLLQTKIRSIGSMDKMRANVDGDQQLRHNGLIDCYDEIVSVMQTHQRLINYSKVLEDVFSMINLINVLLSSIVLCSVVFTIALLEPWMDLSNKMFLGAVLTQVGILCWYADEMFRASMGVADAVYESGWYRSNMRCRRAFLLLLLRSQKPLYFTALKFRNITMLTYSSIITTAYSYFALLYTMYSNH